MKIEVSRGSGIMNKQELKEFVSKVALSQGNRYIKELLRDAELPIGTNKEEFEENLHKAIDNDQINEGSIKKWLGDVEGWGSQNVYLLEPPSGVAFQSHPAFVDAVGGSPLAALFDADNALAFPQALTLTSIRSDHNRLSLEWHKDTSTQRRVPPKDFEKEEEGELYLYKAFLMRHSRTMMRYDYEYGTPFSAIFLQIAKDDDDHNHAINEVLEAVLKIEQMPFPARVSLSSAIERIRHVQQGIATKLVKFAAHGGSVELRAEAEGGIRAVPAVRHVGNAVQANDFPSASGSFSRETPEDPNVGRLRFDIAGAAGRIGIRAQTTRGAMYGLLGYVWTANQNN
jgi:hypothetical protein